MNLCQSLAMAANTRGYGVLRDEYLVKLEQISLNFSMAQLLEMPLLVGLGEGMSMDDPKWIYIVTI